ncbi:hypothetical protein P4H71_04425 [Paenibacillus kribbensis]|uniref:hypothetical protein n=1 Tax=Paenibacillus kribbensis TaxID=172713 RepID=UPI002DBC497D|nr:hypothetical protein [Paenibacillus kribbensis]MEC0233601.1 hypothetical protein [Paenibacillus kribbensis]
MKDFQDFRNSVNPAFYEGLNDIIKKSVGELKFPLDEENATRLFSVISGLTVSITVDVLNGYHDWLASQMEQKKSE